MRTDHVPLKTCMIVLVWCGLMACSLIPLLATTTPSALPPAASPPVPSAPTRTATQERQTNAPPTPTSALTNTWVPTIELTVSTSFDAREIQGWPYESFYGSTVWQGSAALEVDCGWYTTVKVDANSARVSAVTTPTPDEKDMLFREMFSPSGIYKVICGDSRLEMYHAPDSSLVGTTDIHVTECYSVQWAGNEKAVSVVSDDGNVYVWPAEGQEPYLVGHAIPVSWAPWSPDSTKLVVTAYSPVEAGLATFNIAYPDGKAMLITGAVLDDGNQWTPFGVRWLTNDVIQNDAGCGDAGACRVPSYYDAATGEYLISYYMDLRFGEGQPAALSPDDHWLALQSYSGSDSWDGHYALGSLDQFALYDLRSHKSRTWFQGEGPIVFSGWAPDSSGFFFLCYQLEGGAARFPDGLLSLEPTSLRSRQLIPRAISATWSPDRNALFVATADAVRDSSAMMVRGAIYTAKGQALTAPIPISDELAYDLEWKFLIPAKWSHNGDELALIDSSGKLWVLGMDGRASEIASGLPTEEWPGETHFVWSPDDTRLFVYRFHRAWIVDLG